MADQQYLIYVNSKTIWCSKDDRTGTGAISYFGIKCGLTFRKVSRRYDEKVAF